jgi:hypothetical protein
MVWSTFMKRVGPFRIFLAVFGKPRIPSKQWKKPRIRFSKNKKKNLPENGAHMSYPSSSRISQPLLTPVSLPLSADYSPRVQSSTDSSAAIPSPCSACEYGWMCIMPSQRGTPPLPPKLRSDLHISPEHQQPSQPRVRWRILVPSH